MSSGDLGMPGPVISELCPPCHGMGAKPGRTEIGVLVDTEEEQLTSFLVWTGSCVYAISLHQATHSPILNPFILPIEVSKASCISDLEMDT